MNDQWKHRSTTMKCKTCMWYVPKAGESEGSAIGRCRRHAPTMNGYPAVFENDWCGDHKIDENKLEANHMHKIGSSSISNDARKDG